MVANRLSIFCLGNDCLSKDIASYASVLGIQRRGAHAARPGWRMALRGKGRLALFGGRNLTTGLSTTDSGCTRSKFGASESGSNPQLEREKMSAKVASATRPFGQMQTHAVYHSR